MASYSDSRLQITIGITSARQQLLHRFENPVSAYLTTSPMPVLTSDPMNRGAPKRAHRRACCIRERSFALRLCASVRNITWAKHALVQQSGQKAKGKDMNGCFAQSSHTYLTCCPCVHKGTFQRPRPNVTRQNTLCRAPPRTLNVVHPWPNTIAAGLNGQV